jgi:carbon monoxide dehydrogenase subunit G
MRLHFSGQPEIAAPPDRVWRHLMDPHFIAAATPGVESVEVLAPQRFRVVSGLGIGLLKLRFRTEIELYDLVEPETARMRLHGHATGTTVEVQSDIRLEPVDGARVRLHWRADSQVRGLAAGMGTRVMEAAARNLTEGFWRNFARRAAG